MSRPVPRTGTCNLCNGFNPHLSHTSRTRLIPEKGTELIIRFQASLHQLSEAAVSNGCVGCALLHAAFAPILSSLGLETAVKIELKYTGMSEWESDLPGTAVLGMGVDVTDLAKERPGYVPDSFEFFALKGVDDDSQPQPFLLPRLPHNTADSESLRWAQERLDKCQLTHEHCKRRTGTFLPTRLVKIPPAPANHSTTDKVFLIDDAPQGSRYACLSHCWGPPAKMFKTTQASLTQNKQHGIEVARLPQTFRDCISVAHGLGISYIWIDSICIVQDDPEDWRKEASKMCSVYENAHVTIAAAKASNGSAGLFSDVHADYQGHKVGTMGGSRDVYFRRSLDHSALQYFNPDRYLSDYPLLHRGWVYQERFLSTRFLYFGASELILECLSHTVSQCGDGVLARRARDQERKALHSSSLETPSTTSNASFWQNMAMDYSRLALSFTSDYFPALAGLAKQWQARTGARYVAGMWLPSLVNDLQWRVPEGKQQARPEWRAPSWSWASVDSEVRYSAPPVVLMNDAAGVVDVRCTPVPIRGISDDTGALESAIIVLSGVITPATLVVDGDGKCTLRGPGHLWWFSPDVVPVPGLGKASSMDVSLLRIGVNSGPGYENTFELVLRRGATGEFERIGACSFHHDVAGTDLPVRDSESVTIV